MTPQRCSLLTGTSQLPPELSEFPRLAVGRTQAPCWTDQGELNRSRSRPKSDFRPNLPQYPLRPEAIDGITPVFDGVIVLCPDSPVRTPAIPVKKVHPPPQLNNWTSVQDLRAVNAAVHAGAPNVPNPHTISSQMPPDASWCTAVDLSDAQSTLTSNSDLGFSSTASPAHSPDFVEVIVDRQLFAMPPCTTACPLYIHPQAPPSSSTRTIC